MQRTLTRAEWREQAAALHVTNAGDWQLAQAERTLEFWRCEVERLRVELRELLAAADDATQETKV